jgi:hypothetical protein
MPFLHITINPKASQILTVNYLEYYRLKVSYSFNFINVPSKTLKIQRGYSHLKFQKHPTSLKKYQQICILI